MPFDPCRPVRTHLSDWHDGEPLSLPVRLVVRFHLAVCPPCKRVSRSLVATREALRTLRDADLHDADDPSTPDETL